MIQFEFERENKIEFEVNVGNTDHVGSPVVRFGMDAGRMHITFDAVKGDGDSYSAIVPENAPVDLGKTYSCYVEIIIGTKRFVPYNDSVSFTEGNAPSVKINKTKPVKPSLKMKEPEPTTPEGAIDTVLAVKESETPKKPKRVKESAASKLKKTIDKSSAPSPMEVVAEQELKAKADEQELKNKAAAMVNIFKENIKPTERVVGTKIPSITANKPQLSSYTPKSSVVKEQKDYVVNQPLVKIIRTGLME